MIDWLAGGWMRTAAAGLLALAAFAGTATQAAAQVGGQPGAQPAVQPGAQAAAQAPSVAGGEVVERVIAVVDGEPILLSEVAARVQLELQGLQVDESDTTAFREIRRQIRESLIEQRVLAREAEQREINVSDQEVAQAVEEAIARNRAQLGSEERFREQLAREGVTEEELRQRFTTEARREILAARLVQGELRDKVAVTPTDVRQFYDEQKDSLPQREEAFLLQRIVRIVRPDSVSLARSAELAEQVAGQIRGGTLAFADAARRYSDDPNGQAGGDLHRLERGDLADQLGEAFEEQVFALAPQTVSAPLTSPLGLHLFWVREKDPGGEWVQASHILFRVPVLRTDIERTRAEMERLRDRARAGEAFDEMARRYSDAPEGAQGGTLGPIPLGAMEAPLQEALQALEPGEVSEVVEFEGAFLVMRLLEREPARPYAFEEIEEELTDWVRARKMEALYEEWIEEIKERHYVERRPWE